MKNFVFMTIVMSVFSSVCLGQLVREIPPDSFPTQAELDANPNSVIDIQFLNERFSPSGAVVDLNGAEINVVGEFYPADYIEYWNAIFNVYGRLGVEIGEYDLVDTEMYLHDGGHVVYDTRLRGDSLLAINGGLFWEDFYANDDSRLEISGGFFGPDTFATFNDNSVLTMDGGGIGWSILSGHDNSKAFISGGSVGVWGIYGFSQVDISGGEWIQSVFDDSGVSLDNENLQISGSCMAIQGVRLQSQLGVKQLFDQAELSVGDINFVLPNDKIFVGYFVSNPGSVVFLPVSDPCLADLNCSADLNFFDVSLFIDLFAQNDPVADLNTDGDFNFFDVSAFLSAFSDGCYQ